MELFYIVTFVIAIVVLILALTFIGIMIKDGNKTQSFPPNTAQCPDMWIPDGSFCHFNGINNGNYSSVTTGINSNQGNFLKDSQDTIYDFTVSANPDNQPPFFTSGGSNNLNSTTINPFDSNWSLTGLSVNCAQKKWANTNSIQWSGVSQLNNC